MPTDVSSIPVLALKNAPLLVQKRIAGSRLFETIWKQCGGFIVISGRITERSGFLFCWGGLSRFVAECKGMMELYAVVEGV